jgi:hypothetical protein
MISFITLISISTRVLLADHNIRRYFKLGIYVESITTRGIKKEKNVVGQASETGS